MNRQELVKLTARRLETTECDVDHILGALLDSIVLSLAAGHAVTLRRFGTFEPRTRQARKVRVPGGDIMEAPSSAFVGFRMSPALKERLE